MKKIVFSFFVVLFLAILFGGTWIYFIKLPEQHLSQLEQSNIRDSNQAQSTTFLKQLASVPTKQIDYLVLGDSVAKAYGAGDGFFNSVAHYITQRTYKRVTIQNDAEDGLTSAELRELVQKGTLNKAIQQSNIISINIGGDDVLQISQNTNLLNAVNKFSTIKSNYQDNMKAILTTIHALNPKAIVLVNDLYNVLPPQNKLFTVSEKLLTKWNLTTYTIADRYNNVAVVPVDQVLTPQTENKWLTAQVHPNDLGHKLIANKIIGELTTKRSS